MSELGVPPVQDYRRLERLMLAVSYALAVLVALIGFALAMFIYVYVLSHRDTNVPEVEGGITGSTIVFAAFVAAMGRVITWQQFKDVLPKTPTPGEGT